MAKEKKFYVVWQGRKPGVYDNWADCKAQIDGFPDARYKGFPSAAEAQTAFRGNSAAYVFKGAGTKAGAKTNAPRGTVGSPLKESLCVDAAWNTATGDMEYQGVYYKTGDLVFRQGPYADGTNNIGEFLAIVHALAYCKQKGLLLPIYSDSRNAIGWVQQKKANTKLERTHRNAVLFDLIARGEQWLKDNTYKNPILKWETKAWGENPADFGRK
ncbi:ribonuclease H1 domain-containing protein [Dinghuibacter silviterrae]|uniref:Ribonuclease H n=1 Tax=Dinghuibacter silviterrae TaxID=1539049 RepID=A0A4R8DER5_9BACT|nr:ribonuclease H family protein [Dinghuibacter silviterrae]TDW95748.1 ribonuclease HI [Dinghuibacter silviterrae]